MNECGECAGQVAEPRLRIAMLGIRGIPANYGGFETCVEEIAPRMARLGHAVTVYCRAHYTPATETSYRGVTLRRVPTIRNKYLDTIVHSFLSGLHILLRSDYDVVLVFGVGNSPIAGLIRIAGKPVILNVDGLDWMRAKWPRAAKIALRFAERVACQAADRTITDSRFVQLYYKERYGATLDFIPYGANPRSEEGYGTLKGLGLEPDGYFLYVGRLEPENRIHDLVQASRQVDLARPTVVVGDAPYSADYKRHLHQQAAGRVLFPGAIYGAGYWELNHNAFAYVFPVDASGTHPALIEAMACGNCVIARDTPDNRSVGGNALRYFKSVEDLAALMEWSENSPEQVKDLGANAARRARKLFNWDRVTGDYLKLAREVVATPMNLDVHDVQSLNESSDREAVELIARMIFEDERCSFGTSSERERFTYQAAIHGVGPMLGHQVLAGEREVHPDLAEWLITQASHNQERLSRLRTDLINILVAFEQANIQAIPLKGSAMLLSRFEAIGWRPMADIDLLVRHADQQDVDLAYAHAGYCLPQSYSTGLSGLTWKHLHYEPCEQPWPDIDSLGEHPDYPRNIESHPAVLEMYRSVRWDLTGWIVNNICYVDNHLLPDENAMTLHLAVHATINALQSKLRIVQIVDLLRQLARTSPEPVIAAVMKSGPGYHARFVFPALALAARWSDDRQLTASVDQLRPYLPAGMADWIDTAAFYDLSWESRQRAQVGDNIERWAVSATEKARLVAAAILPLPRDLSDSGYSGDGARAMLGWYMKYYRRGLQNIW